MSRSRHRHRNRSRNRNRNRQTQKQQQNQEISDIGLQYLSPPGLSPGSGAVQVMAAEAAKVAALGTWGVHVVVHVQGSFAASSSKDPCTLSLFGLRLLIAADGLETRELENNVRTCRRIKRVKILQPLT